MNALICPSCQHPNRPEAKFCAKCGQRLTAPAVQPTVVAPEPAPPPPPAATMTPVICPYCGQSNRAGAKHCQNCGRDLAGTPEIFQPAPPPSKNRTVLWIILGVTVGCISLLAVTYFVIKALNPFNKIEDQIISPIETAIGTVDITSLPSTLGTALPEIIPTDMPIEIPQDIPLEIPTLAPMTIPGLGLELPHLTDEEEIEIGREAAQEFESDNPISHDPALAGRVEAIGTTLLPYTPRQNLPYTFKVVDTDEINAFALPGGFIYVTRGMLNFVKDDHELAAVIGHELAHVALRHSAQLIENLAATQAALDAITAASPELDAIYKDNSTQLAIDALTTIVTNGWGRENELDADENGTIYMAKAHYSPFAMIDLLKRMQADENEPPDALTLIFATHPPFTARIQRVRETIDKYQLGS